MSLFACLSYLFSSTTMNHEAVSVHSAVSNNDVDVDDDAQAAPPAVRLGRHFLMWIDGLRRPISARRRLIAAPARSRRSAGPASWVARARGGTSPASDNAVVTMNAPACIKRRRPAIVARPNRDLWQRAADSRRDAVCGHWAGQVPAGPARLDLPSLISHAASPTTTLKILNQHD